MPFRLLFRNMLSHPIRTLLTAASVAIAMFLMCVLDAAVTGLDATVAQASRTRLWVQSAVSLFVLLPDSYEAKIKTVPGVEEVVRFQWFGGVYQDPSNFFAQFAVDPQKWFESYPEIEIVDGSLAQWQAGRTNCILGRDLANRFGWQVGDRVPLQGTIFPKTDGTAWEFDVAGIYESHSTSVDQQTMFFDYDYLYESLKGDVAGGPKGVGVYLTRLAAGTNPDGVIAAIEGFYENGPQRVRATREGEFQRQFITMLGSVPTLLYSIGGGVLFAIFFAVLNTMLMAARERTRDIGILKALGFGDGRITALLCAESLLLCAGGGSVGVALAKAAERPIWSVVSFQIPGFEIPTAVVVQGLLLAVGLGLVAGLAPAWRARRLRPVAALRAEA
ncbi:MAG: ABC transporter permease [Planctomycetes bacterium]|nr:ABC transporter permease [Planctomycetota bacterium]